jgi:hypothetical protein
MVANLVGSVAAGFAAVVLGTALARGLAEPAFGPAAAGTRTVETTAVRHPHPTPSEGGPSISARVGVFEWAGGSRVPGGIRRR